MKGIKKYSGTFDQSFCLYNHFEKFLVSFCLFFNFTFSAHDNLYLFAFVTYDSRCLFLIE